jgi:hypothetical protein
MTQKRTFTLNLKNDQNIVLEFTPISATGDRLWQMFATTEALDIVDQIIAMVVAPNESATVAKTKLPAKTDKNPAVKTSSKKK